MSNIEQEHWKESSSEIFIDLGEAFTPWRESLRQMFIDLTPAQKDEAFTFVELGCGQGWLTETLLQHFPHARAIALDGSNLMLQQSQERLSAFKDRVEFHLFKLEESEWLSQLQDIRYIISCLVIHHLDGAGKKNLFHALFDKLQPHGGLIIADLVAPTSEPGRRQMANAWDREVRRRSLELTGNLQAYEKFLSEEWNYYNYLDDPIDMPSKIFEQLQWLQEAGFKDIDVFWAIAGHTLYGGYK
ncbi:class I SAM-dependent methyltransferase [Dictyobacter arantiisoli]|uniref:Methyltransferase type 12 n=1 Tax=Dictyobacter arantiisoli TaxID=2014874 RepID=A0A5A5TFL1_9CHLR|nr:class I SAM-dependent methyltransferase [Dictyobacter arantiisoli]GCF10361.1 methyltransferase type 12 [Dictyobacter arantiisoli]